MKQLFITSVPSFYKNLLFERLICKCDLFVIYTNKTKIKRDANFFKNTINNSIVFKRSNFFLNVLLLYNKGKNVDYIYLGGWDDVYFWVARFLFPRNKLKLIVESSIFEYKKSFFFDNVKHYFLKGISESIVSGKPQEILLKTLGFNSQIRFSQSVGILDFPYSPISKKYNLKPNKFLFIGRICKEKGMDILIDYFSKHPNLSLKLVGEVSEKNYLNKINNIYNIELVGYKTREELLSCFIEHDVLILPSLCEPWGLVVEEAIYHGLPVLVSNLVGCHEDIVLKYEAGLIFKANDISDFSNKINLILNNTIYNKFLENIKKIDFKQKENNYISSFISEKN